MAYLVFLNSFIFTPPCLNDLKSIIKNQKLLLKNYIKSFVKANSYTYICIYEEFSSSFF